MDCLKLARAIQRGELIAVRKEMLSAALQLPAPYTPASERPPEAVLVADEPAITGGLFQVRLKRGEQIKVVARHNDADTAKRAWRAYVASPPAEIQFFDVRLDAVRGIR